MKFTDYGIKNLKSKNERFEAWETNGKGFGLRVSERGRKSFIYMYRFEGKSRRMTLGVYPETSLADAHAKHAKARQLLEKGNDPGSIDQTQKEESRRAPTIERLVEEYLEKWAKVRKRSWKEDLRILYKDVVPVWGKKKARDIKRRDVVLLLDEIHDRGAPIQANRTLATIRKMFNFALSRSILDTSPCVAITAPAKENRRDRVLSEEEICIFWEKLKSARLSKKIAQILKLQLITAQRKGEVTTAEWKDIDLNKGWWVIPAEKSKNGHSHRVPLTQLAIDTLSEIKQFAEYSRWIFPSHLEDRHIKEPSIDRAIRNNQDHFGIDHFTPHDLRRTAATHMTSAGVPRLVVKKILNHVESDITSIYDRHSYVNDKSESMDIWEIQLKSILTGSQVN